MSPPRAEWLSQAGCRNPPNSSASAHTARSDYEIWREARPLQDIYHWWQLDDRVTTSGQPTAAELAALAQAGVREVINLAPHDHPRALPNEAASVAQLGMRYTNIPVDFQNPTEADFTAFCAAMQGTERVHVHCAANYRVAAFLCRYRRDVLGVDGTVARADMEAIWQPDPVWERFLAR